MGNRVFTRMLKRYWVPRVTLLPLARKDVGKICWERAKYEDMPTSNAVMNMARPAAERRTGATLPVWRPGTIPRPTSAHPLDAMKVPPTNMDRSGSRDETGIEIRVTHILNMVTARFPVIGVNPRWVDMLGA